MYSPFGKKIKADKNNIVLLKALVRAAKKEIAALRKLIKAGCKANDGNDPYVIKICKCTTCKWAKKARKYLAETI